MKHIGIRADGNATIGMGHIMRCMAIGKELKNRNIKITFLIKKSLNLVDLLEKNSIDYIIMESSNLKDEVKELKKIINSLKLEALIIDSYLVSNQYLSEINNYIDLLISIDDNSLYTYPSQVVLNGNIYAADLQYKTTDKNCRLLLGSKYTILRDEFINKPPIKIKEKVENILITMGSSDVNNYTPQILKSILDIDIKINVIIGNGFNHIDEIKNLSKENQNINLIYNPSNIAEIMQNNDIAISAAGTTTYELGALGIPTLLITQVANQYNIAKKTAELKMMINIGNYKDVKNEAIRKSLIELIANKAKRKEMNQLCIKYITRDGVKNIVDEILNYKIAKQGE